MRATFASIAEELVSGGLLKRMMNHATGGDVTLGHYVGKSETQLRAGWQTVAVFSETASAKVAQVAQVVAPAHSAELKGRTRRVVTKRRAASSQRVTRNLAGQVARHPVP